MIFVVEDDPTLQRMIGDYLATSGHAVERFERAEDALAAVRQTSPDLVLTDLQLPGMSGVELVAEIGRVDPSVLRVVMTAHATVQRAVEAIRAGAFEFVEKPIDLARLVRLIERALRERRTQQELAWVRRAPADELLGESARMVALREQLATLSRLPAGAPPVLVQGETGVGKGAVARALHRLRFGDAAPFLEINCAALPANLIEAELFGFERSAFTDAKQAKPGLFEAADGGTLFLDELGELPLEAQAKLLKVLESGSVRRLGALKERKVQVSVVAASNVDLERAAREGRFRPDLYHRLAALPLFIPPLRERGDDVTLLAQAFVAEASQRYRRPALTLAAGAREQLRAHDWPGNVRELKFAVERAVLLAPPGATELTQLSGVGGAGGTARVTATPDGVRVELPPDGVSFEVLERAILLRALEATRGNVSAAARLLDLSRDTMRYRVRKHALESHTSADEVG
jgi:DNA-binding NtrC family response regulator